MRWRAWTLDLPRVDLGTEGWSCYSQVSAKALWGVCTAGITQSCRLVGVTLSQVTGGLDTAQLSLRLLASVARAFSGTISPILTVVSGSQVSITVSVWWEECCPPHACVLLGNQPVLVSNMDTDCVTLLQQTDVWHSATTLKLKGQTGWSSSSIAL